MQRGAQDVGRTGVDTNRRSPTLNLILDRSRTDVGAALREAREAARRQDPTLAGIVREILVERILRPALVSEVRPGAGKLVDSMGGDSRPLDVIAYAPELVPQGLVDAKAGVFPVESCLHCVDVKSALTSLAVRNAVEAARSIRRLQYLPTLSRAGGGETTARCPPPSYALFAFPAT